MSDLLLELGGESVQRYGTIVRRFRGDDPSYTHLRASTASYIGPSGSTTALWAADNVPRIDYATGSPVLKLSTTDEFYTTYSHAPQAMTVYAKFIERGTVSRLNKGLVTIGSTDTSASTVVIYASSGEYHMRYRQNPNPFPQANLAVAPSTGDTVELLGAVNPDGTVTLSQSINSATPTIASSTTTQTLGTSWVANRLYVNSWGAASNGLVGVNDFVSVKVARGVKTMGQMRGL